MKTHFDSCKLLKKLNKKEQKAIHERIFDIKRDPFQGRYLQGKNFDDQSHTHARGKSSNLLVIWSVKETQRE